MPPLRIADAGNATPEGLRYLCYTEQGTNNSFTGEEMVRHFHAPQAVAETLARYQSPAA